MLKLRSEMSLYFIFRHESRPGTMGPLHTSAIWLLTQNGLYMDILGMKTFTLAYYGEPKFDSPEKGAQYMAKWKAWVGGLGEALVNPVTPLGKAKIVSPKGVSDDSGSSRLTGFSTVKAASMDLALEMAKRCPHLEHGTIHVGEVMEMK